MPLSCWYSLDLPFRVGDSSLQQHWLAWGCRRDWLQIHWTNHHLKYGSVCHSRYRYIQVIHLNNVHLPLRLKWNRDIALCSDVLCGLSNHPLHNMNMACDDHKRSPSQKRSILYCQSKLDRSLPRRKSKKKPCWHFMSKSTNKHRSLHFRCSTNCTNARVHLIPWDHTIVTNLGAPSDL